MAEDDSMEGEYELIPHQEIRELKEELQKLREFPTGPGTKLQISIDELAKRTDRLNEVFEEAMHEITVEEGRLSFKDKMKPLLQKMDKVLEQNSEIASGIVALADILTELKDRLGGGIPKRPMGMPGPMPGPRPMPTPAAGPRPMPGPLRPPIVPGPRAPPRMPPPPPRRP